MKSPCVSHLPTSLPPVLMLDCLCIPSVNFSPLIFPTSVHLIHDLLPEVRGHGQQISGLSGFTHTLTTRLLLVYAQPLLSGTVFFRFLLLSLMQPPESLGFANGLSGKEATCNEGDTEMQVRSLGREDSLKKEMANCSSILAWKILCTEEPGRLQSKGSQKSQTGLSD